MYQTRGQILDTHYVCKTNISICRKVRCCNKKKNHKFGLLLRLKLFYVCRLIFVLLCCKLPNLVLIIPGFQELLHSKVDKFKLMH